jgi:hypothetical protein
MRLPISQMNARFLMSHQADNSRPPPPELPPRPPDRFQFHLKHLLAYMFACALVAAALRFVVQALGQLPDTMPTRWLYVIVGGLVFGVLLYYFIRAPYVLHRVGQLFARWRAIASHRRAMENWLQQHRDESKRIMEEQDK